MTSLTPCSRKLRATLLRVCGHDRVRTEIVGERARVEVVLVQVAELDTGLLEQLRNVRGHAVVLGTLACRRARYERGAVDETG